MIYGDPRLTNDVDIVAEIAHKQLDGIAESFPSEEFYLPPQEVILVEIARTFRGHFNIIHHQSGFKADIYLAGSDPLHAWAMPRARRSRVHGENMNIAPPEYVILRKLEYFREGGSEKHLHDIRTMLLMSPELIDRGEIDRLVTERGLGAQWELAQRPK
ncbi:MAG TPA: hypothetical protein PLJ47_01835 [Candidatus Hydrogenedentes bacterium]|nr:hypothetical protein [Candidatus Hydrogenedentota bacterium]